MRVAKRGFYSEEASAWTSIANCRISLSLGGKDRVGRCGGEAFLLLCFQMKPRIMVGGGGCSDVLRCAGCHPCVEFYRFGGEEGFFSCL